MKQQRIEIQNLRGISILAVLAFHLAPSRFPNGYLGVDIFFVISGYLITSQLIKTRELPLTDYLTGFYFRRLKRIIPSAISIIILTLVATYLLLGLVTFVQNLQDASWANAFLANWYYLKQNLNYFATGNLNLFQHYWSLAIEEQFYLIWPLILLATKRSKLIPVTLFAISLILFITASYPTTFYGSPHRAWELIAGALLAIYKLNLKQVLAPWFPWILLLTLLIPLKLPQNIATIAVVALSAFFICASANATKKGALFLIGELSFSLYLVHFPVIKIFDELHPNFGAASRLIMIVVITSAIALLNHRLIENPLRYRTYKRPRIAISGFLFTLALLEIAIYLTRGHYV